MSKNIDSISEFLLHAGTDYRVFDMGRGIREIPSQQFLEIENGTRPAPYPRQQHQWTGITYWNQQLSEQRYIWFLKLPLDEQGKVVDAARRHFLELVVTALAESKQDVSQSLESTSKVHDNPYIFTPTQQQLADFNALSRRACGLPTGKDFAVSKQYLDTPHLLDWQKISVQGLSDCVHFGSNADWFNWLDNFSHKYPAPVQKHLLSGLENKPIDNQLANHIAELFSPEAGDTEFNLWCLRSLAQAEIAAPRVKVVTSLLSQEHVSQDTLIVIAGRHWSLLQEERLMMFLEHAAKASNSPDFFIGLFADLAQIPDIRTQVLAAIRNPKRSERLSTAIGWLFSQS
ncbi:DUF3549 family protein [Alteromonas facilis]|uniref:DUF3549 family protein n=1 Tax=Alteromonas facilis TaxID=2048004 RepID=UPI0013DB2086|nr:DUF3549 family protein [Alteromonas facilis]